MNWLGCDVKEGLHRSIKIGTKYYILHWLKQLERRVGIIFSKVKGRKM